MSAAASPSSSPRSAATPTDAAGAGGLAQLTDAELLDRRLCDLNLQITGDLQRRIDRLHAELADRGLTRFKPHCWLSTEWFSPDGVPGIAIPFYLADPRLMRLEKSRMFSVEGATDAACLRILRHEAGHCLDTAYRLHRRKQWVEHFGRFSEPYPETYRPRPSSRKYVVHLDAWYAQAHPAEDFAETFAVWLTPRSRWRSRYAGWPALRKLEYVDQTLGELAEQTTAPPVRSRRHVEPISRDRRTLGTYYREKQAQYADAFSDFIDDDLKRIFSADPRYAARSTAARFLRQLRPELRETVARWTGSHAYSIDQVVGDMIDRCRELKLRLAVSDARARREATLMVTVQTMKHLYSGHRPVAM